MKKKLIAGLLVSALAVSMLGCGSKQAETTPAAEETTETEETAGDAAAETEAEPVTLNVFAAASMTETLTEIQEMYKEVAPNVTLVFNFDSSGTLKTQIQEGADCDIFISAAQKQMNQIDKDADPEVNTDGLDFVLAGTCWKTRLFWLFRMEIRRISRISRIWEQTSFPCWLWAMRMFR